MTAGDLAADLAVERDELDLRLAAPAVLSWVVVAMGQLDLRLTVRWVVVAAVVGTVFLGVLCWRRRASQPRLIGTLAAIGVLTAAIAALTLVRVEIRADSPLTLAADRGSIVSIDGTVRAPPRPTRAANGLMVLLVHTTQIRAHSGPVAVERPVLVLGPEDELAGLLPGQAVTVRGTARPARLPSDVDAVLVSATVIASGDAQQRWQAAASVIRNRLADVADRSIGGDTAGLLVAMVIGDVSGIGPITVAEFRTSGLAHLLAVSGANVAIVLGVVLWLLRRCAVPFAGQVLGCAVGLAGFVAVTGPEPSVLRAAGMGVVLLIGLAGGRPRTSMAALCATVTVLLWSIPELATSIGFGLSVFATAGIILLAPPIEARLTWLPRLLALPVAVTVAATAATLPLTVALQPRVNAIAVPANVLAAVAVPPITVLGLVAAVTAPWAGPVAAVACHLALPLVRWIELVAARAADLGAWRIDWPGGLAGSALVILVGAGCLLLWWLSRRHRLLLPAVVAALLGAGILAVPLRQAVSRWPPDGWVVAACDVGQGDATLIRTGPSQAIMIDTGPDPPAADRCLEAFGITAIPVLVLTHFHADHVGGTTGVLGRLPVGTVLITAFDGRAAESVVRSLALSTGAAVREPAAGERWQAGEVTLTVLGPLRPVLGTDSDANNNSLVLRLDVDGVSLLAAGDAQQEQQRQMAGLAGLDVDVLKVPHHGSAVQYDPFLAATSPRVALVSAGRDNSYGHPAALTLDRMAALGASTYRTDISGDIALAVLDGRLEVVTRAVSEADRGLSR